MAPEPELLPTFEHGPFILAASLCERVLEEKDGVKSAIRMIDQLNRAYFGPTPPAQMEAFQQQLALLIRLKAGAARGNYQVSVRVRKPSNAESATEPLIIQPVHFPGPDDAGIDIVANLILGIDEAGPWWFDVYLNETRAVCIPMRIVYFPQPTRQSGLPPGIG